MAETSIFFGTVHPSGDGLSYDEPIQVDYGDDGWIQIVIHHGHFQALVTMPDVQDDPQSFLNHLTSVVQGSLDALGFHLGLGVTVEIDGGFIAPNTSVLTMRHRWPEAVGRSWGDPLRVEAETLGPFIRAAVEAPLVRFALADVRLALRNAEDTAFYAYRACESIRQWFQAVEPTTENRSVGWRRLRETLHIEEADLLVLAELAKARRHGDGATISESDRLKCIAIAREVVARFVSHLGESDAT